MLASSTHDTKRSEDVRARLNVLSEMPSEWGEVAREWRRLNERHKTGGAPAGADEYLLYQTLVGSWSRVDEAYISRIQAYMLKAIREAKTNTSWTEPNEAYAAFERISPRNTAILRARGLFWNVQLARPGGS
jgi:(1->4)-alpha-D-glucan 1-alpha-D-glucosylmutase